MKLTLPKNQDLSTIKSKTSIFNFENSQSSRTFEQYQELVPIFNKSIVEYSMTFVL
jgi:hypothetical protein